MEFCQTNEEDIALPSKITDGQIRSADVGRVVVNAYEMNLSGAPEQVHQHELRFIGYHQKQTKSGQMTEAEFALEKGPRNDVSKETRRRLHWELFQQLIGQHPDVFPGNRRQYVYDCAILLFAPQRLSEPKVHRELALQVNQNELSERSRTYIRRCQRFEARLLFTDSVSVRNAQAAAPGEDSSTCHFLELLTTQNMFKKNDHFVFGNRAFNKESVIPLQGVQPILKEGMQKNVRFVGDESTSSRAVVQLDAKKTAFFPDYELLHFISGLLNRDARALERDFKRGDIWERVNKQVKDIVVTTMHLPDAQITFPVAGLTRESAAEKTFNCQGQPVRVAQYYMEKYELRLNYPGLPCAIQKKGKDESLYPIELLKIVEGQRVPLEKQANLTDKMIRQCQIMPSNLADQIEKQRDAAFVASGNPYYRAQNIRILKAELIKEETKVLFPPALQYQRNDRVEPNQRGDMDWKLGRREFVVPCQFPQQWAVVNVQQAVRDDQMREFCEKLVSHARARGIQMGLPTISEFFDNFQLEFLHDKFDSFRRRNCSFVLFFAQGKKDARPADVHHSFKLMEIEGRMLTQHIAPDTMMKAISRGGGAFLVLDNVLMKMNLKLGGVNHHLVAAEQFKRANPQFRHDIYADQWLGAKRMFFGIDLSHAPPQTLYEREKGVPAIPSFVGMAYTVGKWMLQQRGTYWLQQARLVTVKTLAQMRPMTNAVKVALKAYHAQNGHYPEHLFFYRGGVSEGEYKKVALWEGNAIRQAIEELREEDQTTPRPRITIIVCQRQSNYRVVPQQINPKGRAHEQNCPPGTVLDKGVMHASLTEFLLIGHRTIQGTAQPMRCTVVLDEQPNEGRVPLTELEHITYALCYQHGICTSPTAIPGVLYSAGDLTKRGRNNWRTHTGIGASIEHFALPPPGMSEQELAQALDKLDMEREEYFAGMSDRLRPVLGQKFWA